MRAGSFCFSPEGYRQHAVSTNLPEESFFGNARLACCDHADQPPWHAVFGTHLDRERPHPSVHSEDDTHPTCFIAPKNSRTQ